MSLEEDWVPNPRYKDPAFRMTYARLVTHYFQHRAWLADGQLLRDVQPLADVPGVLIHGRFDLGGPPDVAWQLAAPGLARNCTSCRPATVVAAR